MNKKIAIIHGITMIAIIISVSQVNLEDVPEEMLEVETVEEIENMIVMPVKSARPDCGPNDECYIHHTMLQKLAKPYIGRIKILHFIV